MHPLRPPALLAAHSVISLVSALLMLHPKHLSSLPVVLCFFSSYIFFFSLHPKSSPQPLTRSQHPSRCTRRVMHGHPESWLSWGAPHPPPQPHCWCVFSHFLVYFFFFSLLFLHSVLVPAQRHLSNTRGVQSRDAGQDVWSILKLGVSSGVL